MTKYEHETRLALCSQIIAEGRKILATGHNPRIRCTDPLAEEKLEKELADERAKEAALHETEKRFEEYNRQRFGGV